MKFFLFLLLVTGGEAVLKRYDGYEVYRVVPSSEEQLKRLRSMERTNEFDFWKEATVVHEPVDIMISPAEKSNFQHLLSTYNLKAERNIDNVQRLIDASLPHDRATSFNWDSYYRLADINGWLESLPGQYPGKVSLLDVGRSYENRPIKGVKVSFKAGNKAVFIEGGIHAREWISPATVTYILYQVLTNQSQTVRSAVESYDWYFFPVYNPDGYEFTFTNLRLWRKNRQSCFWDPLSFICKGTDLNRNWNYKWMEYNGSSEFPCSDQFGGYKPFSAPETKVLSTFIATLKDKMAIYLSFHSYGQYILLPYGYTTDIVENGQELLDIGNKAATSVAQQYGTNYSVGSTIALLKYSVTGDSVDWVKGNFQTPIAFTFELRDKGTYGFLLPPNQIIPTGRETFDGLYTILQEAIARGYK